MAFSWRHPRPCGMVTEMDNAGWLCGRDHWKCKLRIRAAMMLLWKSAGTGHYGYSGEIPVAVIRPLAAIEGPWTWTPACGAAHGPSGVRSRRRAPKPEPSTE